MDIKKNNVGEKKKPKDQNIHRKKLKNKKLPQKHL